MSLVRGRLDAFTVIDSFVFTDLDSLVVFRWLVVRMVLGFWQPDGLRFDRPCLFALSALPDRALTDCRVLGRVLELLRVSSKTLD